MWLRYGKNKLTLTMLNHLMVLWKIYHQNIEQDTVIHFYIP